MAIIIVALLLIVFLGVLVYLYFKDRQPFKLLDINPIEMQTTSDTLTVKFNKKITNPDDIYDKFSTNPNINVSLLVNGNVLEIRPSNTYKPNTNYIIIVPEIKSGNESIFNTYIKFHTGYKVVDNYSQTESLNYQKNMEKYSFMDNKEQVTKDAFSIKMVDSTTLSPSFEVILTPPTPKNQYDNDAKLAGYENSFNSFKEYIGGYGFSADNLPLSIYPYYLQEYLLPNSNQGNSGD